LDWNDIPGSCRNPRETRFDAVCVQVHETSTMQVHELGHLQLLFSMSIGTVRTKGTVRAILVVHAHLGLEPRPADGILFAKRPRAPPCRMGRMGRMVAHRTLALSRIEALLENTADGFISRRNPDWHEAFARRSSWRRVEGRDSVEGPRRRRVARKRRRMLPIIESRRPMDGVGGTVH
jgi:hypothetical protein